MSSSLRLWIQIAHLKCAAANDENGLSRFFSAMLVLHEYNHAGRGRKLLPMGLSRWMRMIVCACIVCAGYLALALEKPLAPPEVGPYWVRPSSEHPAQPVWGHAEGLRVGLWPMTGPRGLLRVYSPYLGHADDRMLNYIAIEPVIQGSMTRSFSELEFSQLDEVDGLRFWSADSPDDATPREPTEPARGVVGHDGDVETLTVYVYVESYRSGAKVVLRLTFRVDRPYEIEIAAFTTEGSRTLASCIVTATMGNYARLRTLHLRGGTRSAFELWPAFDGPDFAPRVCFGLDDLIMTPEGHVVFAATPNEEHPEDADYTPRTFIGWKYYGEVATQVWRSEDPHPLLRGCVNGRTEYWASRLPIPGGIAFENFEMIEPFREGAAFWFGVFPGQGGPLETLESGN